MRFVSFDLETTGFLPGVDQIVEVGAIRYVNGSPEASFVSLVNPLRPMNPESSKVNGITDEMLQDKPTIDKLLEPLTDFLGDDIAVAHNAPFDFQFLLADYKKYQVPAPRGLVLDTCAISRKVFPGLINYKLATLVQHLKIKTTGFHRAEEDTRYCGQLFLHILDKISQSDEGKTIEALIALSNNSELRFPEIQKQPKQLNFLDL